MNELIRRVNNQTILAENTETRVCYHRGCILVYDLLEGNLRLKKNLYDRAFNRFLARFGIFERLLRMRPRLCISLSDNSYLLSNDGQLYVIDCEHNSINKEIDLPLGTKNPLYICSTRSGELFFGEYSWNMQKGKVGIYAKINNKWYEYCHFPENSVCHIHNIIDDPVRNCLWVFTGDEDCESGIWTVNKNSRIIKPFLVGSQKYRACFAFIEEDHLIYVTDTPFQKNAVYSVSINDKSITKLYEIPGPCIYGKEYMESGKKYRCFATSVEPDSSLKGLRYKLTYRLGKGVIDRKSHIIVLDSDLNYHEIYAFKKDFLPMWLFQFGNIQFADRPMHDGAVYINPTAIKSMNRKTFEVRINMEVKK